MYLTYILRCEDDTLYTGIAADLERRMRQHFSKDKRCARYTRWHTAKQLEAAWESEDRASASRLEYRIKQLTREQKERLIAEDAFAALLGEVLEAEDYRRMDLTNEDAEQL